MQSFSDIYMYVFRCLLIHFQLHYNVLYVYLFSISVWSDIVMHILYVCIGQNELLHVVVFTTDRGNGWTDNR